MYNRSMESDSIEIQHIKLGLLGFGNVLKAFAELLPEKADIIRTHYGIEFSIVGIATNSHGIAINPKGIDPITALEVDDLRSLHQGKTIPDAMSFVQQCPADMILEAIWVNPKTGQPALDLCRAALQAGKHVITANKGPVAFGFRELNALAAQQNLGFFFESTVMDGTPLHSIGREALLAVEVTGIRGVLNSTTNAILTHMEEGGSFEEALREMQEAGVAETDPSNDIDGWDAAIKIVILANTLMGADLRPDDVDREGIREVTYEDIQAAVDDGMTLKLVCEAYRDEDGIVQASVQPTTVEPDDPLAWLDDTASAVTIFTDVIEEITIREGPASPRTTAYGMLVDAINITRGRR